METAGHLAPHWRDPTLDPAGRRWQSDMKDEAQKWTSTGTEKTKPCFSLLPHCSSSLKTVSATLFLLWQKQPNWKRDSAFSLTFLQSMRLTLYMCLFFWTLTNFIQMRGKQLKTTSGTCVRNYKKKHICVHFLLGNCPVLRNFDASCSQWLHASVCTVLLHWQALASLSFSIFFFSQRNICWQGWIRAWINFSELGILAWSHRAHLVLAFNPLYRRAK